MEQKWYNGEKKTASVKFGKLGVSLSVLLKLTFVSLNSESRPSSMRT